MAASATVTCAVRDRSIIEIGFSVTFSPTNDIDPISRLGTGWEELAIEEEALDFVADLFEGSFPPGECGTVTTGTP